MVTDADIRVALETPLFAVSGFPDADHRELENTEFEPTVGESWVRVTHFFGLETLGTLPASGGTQWRRGILSLGLFYPILESTTATDALAQAIRDALPPGKTLAVVGRTLSITENRRGNGRRDPRNYWHVPVDIIWKLRAVNPSF